MNMTADTGVAETPEFEIKRTLTTEDMNEFFKFTCLKYRPGTLIIIIAFLAFDLFAGIRGRAVGLGVWWAFILAAVLSVFFSAAGVIRVENYNRRRAGREAVYLFYRDHMVNRYDGRDANIPYTHCEAFEYGGRIIIVVNKGEGYVLSAEDFSEPDKFREFLKMKLGDRFK